MTSSPVTVKTLAGLSGTLIAVIAALVVWIFLDSRSTERSFETEARATMRASADKVHELELKITRCCR